MNDFCTNCNEERETHDEALVCRECIEDVLGDLKEDSARIEILINELETWRNE